MEGSPHHLVVHLSVVLDAQVVAVCIGNFGSTADCPWFPAEVVPDEPGKPLASQDLVPRSLDVEVTPPPRGVVPAQSGGQLGVGLGVGAAHDLSCILHLWRVLVIPQRVLGFRDQSPQQPGRWVPPSSAKAALLRCEKSDAMIFAPGSSTA